MKTTRRPAASDEHDAVAVGIAAQAAGRDHGGCGLAEPLREAAARLHDGGAGAAEGGRKAAPHGAGHPRAARPVLRHQRREPAGVVGVQVRDHERVEAAHPEPVQRRLHRVLRAGWAPVDESGPGAAAKRGGVALPDVDEDDAQRRRPRRSRGTRRWVVVDLAVGVAAGVAVGRRWASRRRGRRSLLPGRSSRPHPTASRPSRRRRSPPRREHRDEQHDGEECARARDGPAHRVTLPARADASCPAEARRASSPRRWVQPRQPHGQKEHRDRPASDPPPPSRRRASRRSSAACRRPSCTCTSRARSSPSSCSSSAAATASLFPAPPPRNAAPSTASATSRTS